MIKRILPIILLALINTAFGQNINTDVTNFKKSIGQIKQALTKEDIQVPAPIKKNIVHIKQGLKELGTHEKPLSQYAQERLQQIKSTTNITSLIDKIKQNLDKIRRYVTDVKPELKSYFNNAQNHFKKIESAIKKALPKS